MAGSNPESAMIGAIHRTIPNACREITVNTTASQNLDAVTADEGVATPTSLLGRWVMLEAVGADVRVLRDASAIAAGRGLLLVAGAGPVDFYIDRDGAATLQAVSAAAAKLLILYDTEQK